MKLCIIVTFVAFLALPFCPQANEFLPAEGTNFITAFPQSRDNFRMTPSLYFMTLGSDSVTVSVESHSSSSYPFTNQTEVFPGRATRFSVNYRFEHPIGSVITNDAIKITASSPIVVDVKLLGGSNDDFHSLIPNRYLGTDYFVAGFIEKSNITANFILVAARTNNTKVVIELNKLTDGETIAIDNIVYDHRDILNLTLNELQTLQIQSVSDLTGTRLRSSKPVAVYSGQNRTYIEGKGVCYSHMSDPIPPVNNLGRRFVMVSSPDQSVGDFYLIIASQPFTTVILESDPRTSIRLKNPGDFHEHELTNVSYLFAEADKPVMVVQITRSNTKAGFTNVTGDPSMGVLAPLEQAESFYVFAHTNKKDYLYFTFAVLSSEKNGVLLNNQTLSDYGIVWTPVQGTDIVAGYILLQTVPAAMMTLHHETDHVFSVHVNSKRMCECSTMPLTYGKHLTEESVTASYGGDNDTFECTVSAMVNGDGVDNDCDRRVDEEACDPDLPETDDDEDGFLNEDCAAPTAGNIMSASKIYRPIFATKKLAEIVRKRSVKGRGECALVCLQEKACWGINFSPLVTSTSDHNCELLIGSGLGRVVDDHWQYYES